jgi:hypothetical protein
VNLGIGIQHLLEADHDKRRRRSRRGWLSVDRAKSEAKPVWRMTANMTAKLADT